MYLFDERVDGLVAAAVAHENALLYGPPGWGKTSAALSFLARVFGEETVGLLVFSPATPPERVEGGLDVPAYLHEGVIRRTVDGTPFDPRYLAWVLDEVGRGNEAVLDALLPVLERPWGERPMFIGTTNFEPRGKRFEALKTRFGLWVAWEPPADPDELFAVAQHVVRHGGKWGVNLTDDIVRAIHYAREHVLEEAVEMLRPLIEAGVEDGFALTPRWVRVMTNVVTHGAAFFAALDGGDVEAATRRAFGWLEYAIPTSDEEARAKWRAMVRDLAAPGEAAIERVMREWRAALERHQALSPAERVAPENAAALRDAYQAARASLSDLQEQGVEGAEEAKRQLTREYLRASR